MCPPTRSVVTGSATRSTNTGLHVVVAHVRHRGVGPLDLLVYEQKERGALGVFEYSQRVAHHHVRHHGERQPLEGSLARRQKLRYLPVELREHLVHKRQQKRLLRLEVPVHRSLRHLQARRDVGERGVLVALPGKERERAREYARARLFSVLLRPSCHLVRSLVLLRL